MATFYSISQSRIHHVKYLRQYTVQCITLDAEYLNTEHLETRYVDCNKTVKLKTSLAYDEDV